MSQESISYRTVGGVSETLLLAPTNRKYLLLSLTTQKDSAYRWNLSKHGKNGVFQIITLDLKAGDFQAFNEPQTIVAGESLICQSSDAGIDVNITYEVVAYVG